MHLPATPNAVRALSLVFYELHSHSGFRLNLIWLEWPRCQNDRNTLEGAMVARNIVLLVQGVTCQIQPRLPEDMNQILSLLIAKAGI